MKVNNDPVINRNHFLPTLYLKGFEDTNAVLWRYDQKDGKIVDGNAEFFGFEKRLYHPEPPADPNKYEHFFRDKIESPAYSVLKKLRNKQFPSSEEERVVLSHYFAALLVRTPMYINLIQKGYDEEINLINLALAQNEEYNEDHKRFYSSKAQYDKARQDVLDGKIKMCATKDHVLYRMAEHVPTIGFLMAHMSWVLIENCSEEGFITSDNLNYIYNPHINPKGFYSPGFGLKDSSIYIPVSSSLTLQMIQDGEGKNIIQNFNLLSTTLLQKLKAYSINNILGFNVADRFIFGNSKKLLENIVKCANEVL